MTNLSGKFGTLEGGASLQSIVDALAGLADLETAINQVDTDLTTLAAGANISTISDNVSQLITDLGLLRTTVSTISGNLADVKDALATLYLAWFDPATGAALPLANLTGMAVDISNTYGQLNSLAFALSDASSGTQPAIVNALAGLTTQLTDLASAIATNQTNLMTELSTIQSILESGPAGGYSISDVYDQLVTLRGDIETWQGGGDDPVYNPLLTATYNQHGGLAEQIWLLRAIAGIGPPYNGS